VNTPRLRNDLNAKPIEEQGIKYFDVSDPRSGARMRMYDFEWLIASRMDGQRAFDEVAAWARAELGLQPSPQDLEEYASKLRALGFFEKGGEKGNDKLPPLPATGAQPAIAPGPVSIDIEDDVTPLPQPQPMEADRASTEIVIEQPKPAPEPEPLPKPPASEPAPKTVVAKGNAAAAQPDRGVATGKVDAVDTPAAAPPEKKSSVGAIVAIFVVLAAIGGGVAYVKFGPQAAHVTVVLAAPREVVRLFDGASAVKKADAQSLSFGENGKVVDVVAKGTEAKAGMPLATLESYAKIEKDLTDVKDRLVFYEKQAQAAQAKNNPDEVKKAEAKVAEKKQLLDTLQARAGKARIVAPAGGTVADVMVAAGEEVRAGAPVVRMGDKRLTVDFKVPAGEAPKVGETVQLQPAGGGATIAGRVVKSNAGTLEIDVPDESSAKAGDQLRLVRARQQNVIPVPASAVVKRDGADTVFVLTDGVAKARTVTIVDRTATECLVSAGLATGDSVITSNAADLQDGQKASVN
jgi:multidrug efflux pump subunit AcrA (membrane-fusion protein)